MEETTRNFKDMSQEEFYDYAKAASASLPNKILVLEGTQLAPCPDKDQTFIISSFKLDNNREWYVYSDMASSMVYEDKRHALLKAEIFGLDLYEPPSYTRIYKNFSIYEFLSGRLKKVSSES